MTSREIPTAPALAVVVSSCDAFADVWEPFFTLFFRYWPDCPYPLFLIANERRFEHPRVTTLCVGEDRGWTDNLRAALGHVPGTHLLYLQEDYLLRRAVDTPRVAALFAHAVAAGAACLRLFPTPGPDEPYPGGLPGVGRIGVDAPYRVSLQAAIWDRRALEALLVPGESGWQMETLGSARSRSVDAPFLSVERRPRPSVERSLRPGGERRPRPSSDLGVAGSHVVSGDLDVPIPYVCTAVVKGKWIPAAVALCRAEGIPLDLSRRSVETWRDRAWRRLMTARWVTRLRAWRHRK
jgi:hypothetical protein